MDVKRPTMTLSDKLTQLRMSLLQQLLPLIDNDYWILELPNHSNVGDTLILDGELELLKHSSHKCRHICSIGAFNFPVIPHNEIILINGGGSFGDVWPESMAFKMSVISQYPNNKIIFFPQSVHFNDKTGLGKTISALQAHGKTIVCVRDQYSYDLLRSSGFDNTCLTPDIAFFMNLPKELNCPSQKFELYIPRNDREFKPSPQIEKLISSPGIVIKDWPPLTQKSMRAWCFKVLTLGSRFVGPITDLYMLKVYKKFLIHEGISLIKDASTVYSTRLHGGILALLLGKKVVLIDNAQGKCSHFFNTWLYDCENISLEK